MDTPAEALGISTKTLQRRKKAPESTTLEELQKMVSYATTKGGTPKDTIRTLLSEDLGL